MPGYGICALQSQDRWPEKVSAPVRGSARGWGGGTFILGLRLRRSADADVVDAPGRPVLRLDSTLPAGDSAQLSAGESARAIYASRISPYPTDVSLQLPDSVASQMQGRVLCS